MVQDFCCCQRVGVERDFIHAAVEGQESGIVARANLAIEIVIGEISSPATRRHLGDAVDIENESRAVKRSREMIPCKRLNGGRSLRECSILGIEYPKAIRPRRLVEVPSGGVVVSA